MLMPHVIRQVAESGRVCFVFVSEDNERQMTILETAVMSMSKNTTVYALLAMKVIVLYGFLCSHWLFSNPPP